MAGFAAGGFVAGRLAHHSHRFHGSVTGLGLAAVVVFISRGGGSQASVIQILIVAGLGIGVGGLGGLLAGRRRAG